MHKILFARRIEHNDIPIRRFCIEFRRIQIIILSNSTHACIQDDQKIVFKKKKNKKSDKYIFIILQR